MEAWRSGIILETERLALRELEIRDASDLAEILQNPAVMFAYEHTFTNQDVYQWLGRQRGRYLFHGFGLWAVCIKNTGCMIGQAGLTLQPYRNTRVLEVGYLLKQQFWHQGYATEAAKGCMQYAFHQLEQPIVHAIIKADNRPSIAVAERLGMLRADTFPARYYSGARTHLLYLARRSIP